MVLIEAMSVGLPIAATRVGAVEELVKDGRTGVITLPNSVASIAEGIVKILRLDEATRLEWQNEARTTIVRQFDIRVVANTWEQCYLLPKRTLKSWLRKRRTNQFPSSD